jgi:hypothetical protein
MVRIGILIVRYPDTSFVLPAVDVFPQQPRTRTTALPKADMQQGSDLKPIGSMGDG